MTAPKATWRYGGFETSAIFRRQNTHPQRYDYNVITSPHLFILVRIQVLLLYKV